MINIDLNIILYGKVELLFIFIFAIIQHIIVSVHRLRQRRGDCCILTNFKITYMLLNKLIRFY